MLGHMILLYGCLGSILAAGKEHDPVDWVYAVYVWKSKEVSELFHSLLYKEDAKKERGRERERDNKKPLPD